MMSKDSGTTAIPQADKWTREQIDAWPVATAGLPVRVAHAAQRNGFATVGAVRQAGTEAIRCWTAIGPQSLRALNRFWTRCHKLEQGQTCFATVQAWLEELAGPADADVLARRYGFYPTVVPGARGGQTLQAVGTELQVSRERIRQRLARAYDRLNTELGRATAAPFLSRMEACVRRADGVCTVAGAISATQGDPGWSGYRVDGVWRLLSKLDDAPVRYVRDCFTTMPADWLAMVDRVVAAQASHVSTPVARSVMADALAAAGYPWEAGGLQRWLDHDPRLWSLRDGRYLWRAHGCGALLDEYAATTTGSVHFREISRALNGCLTPPQQIGPGRVLRTLRRHAAWQMQAPGWYQRGQ